MLWKLRTRKELIAGSENWTVSCICPNCNSPASQHELFSAYFPGIPDDIAEQTALRFAENRLENAEYTYCPVCGTKLTGGECVQDGEEPGDAVSRAQVLDELRCVAQLSSDLPGHYNWYADAKRRIERLLPVRQSVPRKAR